MSDYRYDDETWEEYLKRDRELLRKKLEVAERALRRVKNHPDSPKVETNVHITNEYYDAYRIEAFYQMKKISEKALTKIESM